MENMVINELFGGCYNGKTVLITGNTGFKGAWLSTWLLELGANVYGISNGIPTKPYSLFEDNGLEKRIGYILADIRDSEKMKNVFSEIKPDFVFHLAAQPIVFTSYQDPVETMNTNIMGTVNILEALRCLNSPCTAIMITSDKCYDNVEWIWGYREIDALGGKDPYSASKSAAEFMIKTYYHSYFSKPDSPVRVISVRAGNVIGGGDWAENRIVPDCIRAWNNQKKVKIRSPQSTRPWQHVLEPLSGYLQAGQLLSQKRELNGEAFNFGPEAGQNNTVLELIDEIAKYWGENSFDLYEVIPPESFYESGLLKLNCDKALQLLKWKAVLSFEQTVKFTSLWYKIASEKQNNMYDYSVGQIIDYIDSAVQKQLGWCSNLKMG